MLCLTIVKLYERSAFSLSPLHLNIHKQHRLANIMQVHSTTSETQPRFAPHNAEEVKAGTNTPVVTEASPPPASEEVEIVMTRSVRYPSHRCFCVRYRSVLGVAGWVTVMINLANMVTMLYACYQLNAYLNAPHPGDDAYYLAGVAYLVLLPSLADSILICIFTLYVLFEEYSAHRAKGDGALGGPTNHCTSRPRWICYVVICLFLFAISCWPAGVAIFLLPAQLIAVPGSAASIAALDCSLWLAVCATFAYFGVLLCTLLRPRENNSN